MTILGKMVEDKQAGTPHVAKRELEVLQLLSRGYNTPRVAAEMNVRPETIVWYRKQLHLKFDVHSTAELLVKAIEQKII